MELPDLLGLFVSYGYWILAAAVFLDKAGLPIPGELLLLAVGAVARSGDLNLGLGLLLAAAAAVGGDSAGYWLGRWGGDRLLRTYCRATLGSGRCVEQAVGFYERYGRAAVVFGRFVVGVRAFLPSLAGSARMPIAQFLLYDSVGALLWSSLFTFIGYGFGRQLELIGRSYRAGWTAMIVVLLVGVAIYLAAKVARRWRHGPARLAGEAIGRARGLGVSSRARAR